MQINNIKNLTFFQLHDGSNYSNNLGNFYLGWGAPAGRSHSGNYLGNLYLGRPSGDWGIGVPSLRQKDNGII